MLRTAPQCPLSRRAGGASRLTPRTTCKKFAAPGQWEGKVAPRGRRFEGRGKSRGGEYVIDIGERLCWRRDANLTKIGWKGNGSEVMWKWKRRISGEKNDRERLWMIAIDVFFTAKTEHFGHWFYGFSVLFNVIFCHFFKCMGKRELGEEGKTDTRDLFSKFFHSISRQGKNRSAR